MNLNSLQQLQRSLSRIESLIRAAIERAQAAGQDPTDALRGLVITDDDVARQLDREPLEGLWGEDEASTLQTFDDVAHLPFQQMIARFGLNVLDSYILLLALAPEVDRRYERLYAYLHDDVSQRRPTVNLMMNLLGTTLEQRYAVWDRLQPNVPLRRFRLIDIAAEANRTDAPFLAQVLRVDHRIVAHLLGDVSIDPRLKHHVKREDLQALLPTSFNLSISEPPIVYMRGGDMMGQIESAAALCMEHNLPLISVNLAGLKENDAEFDTMWRLAIREGYLAGAALFLDKWDSILAESDGQPPVALWEMLQSYPGPVFIAGKTDWEPLDMYRQRRLIRMNFALPAYPERREAWDILLAQHEIHVPDKELDELVNKFRFTRRQIARAVQTACDLAVSRGEHVNMRDLYAGSQAHATLRLGKLASKIEPRYDWDDLILPPEQTQQLREIADRALHSYRVHQEWGYGDKIAPTVRISALFAGDSGTGKTLSAEVVAKTLGLVMYKVDLSSVVSKYIGETEKNLGAIFDEARSSNAVLFFDEADALFGKRSEVKDARDRYANIEVAYLLQQIETYDGVAIMATNLRQNLDEAFTRRLDFVIDFPFPEPEYRQRIWRAHFPSRAPLGPDVDLREVAEAYRLAGGNIRNAAIASAYLAAADGGTITMAHIRNAVRRENQKMGRLLEDYVRPSVRR